MLVANNEADLCLMDTFHLDNGCEFSNSLMEKVTATLDIIIINYPLNQTYYSYDKTTI